MLSRVSRLCFFCASQADASEVTLWRPAPAGSAPAVPALGAPEGSTGSWRQLCALRGHADDVQDLAWAPCGGALLSGSVDNQAIVWDVARRQGVNRLEGHTHYVQGVAWDPAGEFLVTQAGDRTARVWGPPPPRAASAKGAAAKRCAGADAVLHSKIVTAPAPAAAAGAAAGAPAPPRAPMFHDENMPSFFRRLAWSPEGSVLAAPAGQAAARGAAAGAPPAQPRNVTWLFKRRAWAAPAAALPGPPSAGGRAVAVRFSPVLYAPAPPPAVAAAKAALADAAPDAGTAAATSAAPPVFALPYRMVFAVATLDHVSVYDTGDVAPLAVISALHFAAITDLAWSPDGNTLAVASADGFCSLVTFEPGELGEPLPAEALPADVAARLPAAAVARAVAAAAAAAAAPQPPPSEQLPPPQHAPQPQQPGGPRRIVPMAAGAPPADAPRRIVPVAVADPPPPPPAEPEAVPPAATSPGDKRPLDAPEASPAKAARTDDAAGVEAAIEIE